MIPMKYALVNSKKVKTVSKTSWECDYFFSTLSAMVLFYHNMSLKVHLKLKYSNVGKKE